MIERYRYLSIAANEAGLTKGYFFLRGLPEPGPIQLLDYSTIRPQAQGGRARHGYAHGSVMWPVLSQRQSGVLYALIVAAEVTYGEGNATLWMTLPRTTGKSTGQDWVDISGIVPMPKFQAGPGGVYQNVVLEINDVTFENDPSNAL